MTDTVEALLARFRRFVSADVELCSPLTFDLTSAPETLDRLEGLEGVGLAGSMLVVGMWTSKR
jgi:hypothetical protein